MFQKIIYKNNNFTLLLAPPSWGKTSMLIDMYRNFDCHIVFTSPLKALSLEFFNRTKHFKNTFCPYSKPEVIKKAEIFTSKSFGLFIITVELLSDDVLAYFKSISSKIVFVLDELHLFYYWGDSFRPHLLETWMKIANLGFPILGLTATFSDTLLSRWRRDVLVSMDSSFIIDFGRGKLATLPRLCNYFSPKSKKYIQRRFFWELLRDKNKSILYFCQYREEVSLLTQYCKKINITAIGCRGGEVLEFINQLKENPNPQCIICTSSLSHGVNLPSMDKVFISYEVENKDLFLQMIARGGRNGEDFDVCIMDSCFQNKFKNYLDIVINVLIDVFIRFHIPFLMV